MAFISNSFKRDSWGIRIGGRQSQLAAEHPGNPYAVLSPFDKTLTS